jgi:hypothetical protein
MMAVARMSFQQIGKANASEQNEAEAEAAPAAYEPNLGLPAAVARPGLSLELVRE